MKSKTRLIYTRRSLRHQASKLPTEKYPDIDQDETNTQQEKSQDGIAASGCHLNTAQQTILHSTPNRRRYSS